jgi:hypothetical protein
MGDMDTSSARSLWALEPHEREALTTKYKAIYLEKEKRAFLKNILGGNEAQSKKAQVVKRGVDSGTVGSLTAAGINQQALSILKDEFDKQYAIKGAPPGARISNGDVFDSGVYGTGALNISGQHARNTLPDSNTNQYQYGWRDPRGTDEPNNN